MKLLQQILNYFRRTKDDLTITPEPIDEPKPEPNPEPPPTGPDDDGWFRRPNGERFRPVPNGMGYEISIDDEPRKRRGDRRWNATNWWDD